MVKGRNITEQTIIDKVTQSGNEHIFYFWNQLIDSGKDRLISRLREVSFEQINSFFLKYKQGETITGDLLPTDYCSLSDRQSADYNIGLKAMQNGEVAFVTVAGGQASRLGYDKPKGCFPISPVKQKTLFQIFAEKILYYSKKHNRDILWLIMTSEGNNKDTVDFFENNKYFGLRKEQVKFFVQGMLPTVTETGKLILADKDTLFTNPDGHGGILTALVKSGLLDLCSKKGIKVLSYFQVDNPLVSIADYGFIGYHIRTNSSVSSKVIAKEYPEEKLGVICRRNGTNDVVEYSDLPKDKMYETDKNGKLKYLMGSIAIHIFDVDFLHKFTAHLEIHFANKKIKGYVFENNKEPVHQETAGIKFETFVFNTIPLAPVSVFYETDRNEEFYPLKNKTGVDSIDTCIEGQNKMFFNWLKDAGIIERNTQYNNQKIEISPLYASDRLDFINKTANDKQKLTDNIFDRSGVIKSSVYVD